VKRETIMEKKQYGAGDECYAFDSNINLRHCVVNFRIGEYRYSLKPIDDNNESHNLYLQHIFETKEAAYEWALQKLQTEFNELQKNG